MADSDGSRLVRLLGARGAEVAVVWSQALAPALATWAIALAGGLVIFSLAHLWHPAQRRVHRRSTSQQALLGCSAAVVIILPLVVVRVLQAHGMCSAVGTVPAYYLALHLLSCHCRTGIIVHGPNVACFAGCPSTNGAPPVSLPVQVELLLSYFGWDRRSRL